jgi:hypothetical protein
LETTADQLDRIQRLAWTSISEISIIPLDKLPPDLSEKLLEARRAAERIKTLFDEEFGIGVRGGLVELEDSVQ